MNAIADPAQLRGQRDGASHPALASNGVHAHLLICLARLVIVADTHLFIAIELHRRAYRQPLFQREASSFSHLKRRNPPAK